MLAIDAHAAAPAVTLPWSAEMGAAERSLLEARYQRLLREHGGAISRLASGYERIAGRREDLVQEIALAIWQALPRFRGDCSEKTFVYRIAQNRCLTHALRRKPGGNSLEGAAPPVDLRPGPESAALAADLKERLLAAIRALALPYRQVITLVLEEMSHAEIAEVLGLTENNVGVRLNRAREKLREILGATR